MPLNERERLLWRAFWETRDRPPAPFDFDYWVKDKGQELYDRGHQLRYRGRLASGNPGLDYTYEREIGWQAGGPDVPPFGPYAQPPSAMRPVPPYPGEPTPADGEGSGSGAGGEGATGGGGAPAPAFGDQLQKLVDQVQTLVGVIDVNVQVINVLIKRLEKLQAEGIRVHL